MITTPQSMTAAQLLTYHDPADRRTELVRGRLLVSEPPGWEHGEITLRVGRSLTRWVEARELAGQPVGRVAVGDPGFWIARDPDTVRAPDVAFVAAERMPPGRVRGFIEHAPTLAVEVVSPADRPGAVLAKVAQWLDAGTALVWTIDPERREARVYRADGSQLTIDEEGALDGEAVLPGFTLSLASLLG